MEWTPIKFSLNLSLSLSIRRNIYEKTKQFYESNDLNYTWKDHCQLNQGICIFANEVKCNENRFQLSFLCYEHEFPHMIRCFFFFFSGSTRFYEINYSLNTWVTKNENRQCRSYKPLTNLGFGSKNYTLSLLVVLFRAKRPNLHLCNEVRSKRVFFVVRFVFVPEVIGQIFFFHLVYLLHKNFSNRNSWINNGKFLTKHFWSRILLQFRHHSSTKCK